MATNPADASATDRRVLRVANVAAALSALAFLPSLADGFVYDDQLLISENPYAQRLEFVFRGFRTHLWDVYSMGSGGFGLRYYRPIVTASYVLNWVFSNGAAWTFHLVNVVCHALATWLATRIAARWTGSAGLGLVAGLLFALHPTRTESVIWISGRTDVFMALFAFAAIELAHAASRSRGRPAVGFSIGAVLCLALAVLSKEAAVLTALLVFADALLAAPNTPERRRGLQLASLFAALGLGYVLVRDAVYPVRAHSTLELTPLYGFFTVSAYAERILFPWPQTFFFRPAEELAGHPHFPIPAVVSGVVLVGAYGALLWKAFRVDRAAFVLLLAAAGSLGPLLNFTFTKVYVTTSDHFLYVPLFLGAAAALRLYRDRVAAFSDERVWRLAIAGLMLVYVGVDVVRVLDYHDPLAFWRHELDVNPDNPVALTAVSEMDAEAGDIALARDAVVKALSPSSERFFLLAGDANARASRRGRFLGLDASLTADGDVAKLERTFTSLDRLLRATRSPDDGGPLDEHGLFKAISTMGTVGLLAVDTAFVGTRIGEIRRANELMHAVPTSMLWHVSNPMNFVLLHARLGDFIGARRLLALSRSPPPGVVAENSPETLAEVAARLDSAEKLFRRATHEPDAASRIDGALALAELGSYLQALRLLRPLFDPPPGPESAGPLYVQLLVSARLEQEALATATALIGPERAQSVVERLHAEESPRVRSLPAPAEPSRWWNP